MDRMMISSPAMPSPAFTIIWEISVTPVKIAAPMPITYIQTLTKP